MTRRPRLQKIFRRVEYRIGLYGVHIGRIGLQLYVDVFSKLFHILNLIRSRLQCAVPDTNCAAVPEFIYLVIIVQHAPIATRHTSIR